MKRLLCAILLFCGASLAQTPQLVPQIGHADNVWAVAFSPDGALLASVGPTVKLWDARSGELRGELSHELPSSGTAAQFLSDGRLAVCGWRGASFWNLRDGTCRRVMVPGGVTALSADGALLAATRAGNEPFQSTENNVIRVINTRTAALWRELRFAPRKGSEGYREDKARALAFSRDGATLAAGFENGFVRLWDVATGALRIEFSVNDFGVTALGFSPDGKTLGVGGGASGYPLRLWDATTGKATVTLADGDSNAQSIVFSPDGALVATPGGWWNARSGARLGTLAGHLAVAFAPDGAAIAFGSGAPRVQLKSLRQNAPAIDFAAPPWVESGLAFSRDGRTLAWGRTLWDVARGRLKAARDVSAPVSTVSFTSNGVVYALERYAGDRHFTELWWRDAAGRLQKTRELSSFAQVAPGGRFVAIGAHESMRVVDLQTGKARGPFKAEQYTRGAFAFAPDGLSFATAVGGFVKVWDSQSGQLKKALQKPQGSDAEVEFTALAFSPRGKYVAAAGYWPAPTLWDAKSGALLRRLQGQCEGNLEFSPDEKLLAISGTPARVWNVATGQIEYTLPFASHLRFSPDGWILAALTPSGLQLWNARRGELLAILCLLPSESGDALSGTPEWLAFTPDGFYDASPGAARFIRWRVGEQLFPAQNFAAQFQRPETLRHLLDHQIP